MFTSFLFDRLSHYKEFYKTEDEFVQHLMSGDVKISIPDLIRLHSTYETEFLPSQFQINDGVCLSFDNTHKMNCRVIGVHFYSGKVKYDLEVEIENEVATRVYNVDSCFVAK